MRTTNLMLISKKNGARIVSKLFKCIRATFLFISSGCLVLSMIFTLHGSKLTDFLLRVRGGAAFVVLAYGIVKHFEDPQTSYFFVWRFCKWRSPFKTIALAIQLFIIFSIQCLPCHCVDHCLHLVSKCKVKMVYSMDQIYLQTPNPKCRPYWCLKVPKREIFDRSDFPDFYTIKSLCVGDFGVTIKKCLKNI
jgi:hypothetical protein